MSFNLKPQVNSWCGLCGRELPNEVWSHGEFVRALFRLWNCDWEVLWTSQPSVFLITMHCRALKQEQILSCALRECDFNHRFVWEAMGYGMMLWKGTVLSSGWRNWRKICEVIRLRAKRLVTSCFLSNETCDCSEFSRDEI